MADNSTISTNNPETRKDAKRDPTYGIYIGTVISTKDLSRTGRILVFIAALGKDPEDPNARYSCTWTSPFAGGTDPAAIGGKIESYEQTQKSYGMWMVPPDVGNLVLVCFGDGNLKFPFVIGCLFPDKNNYMVPGMASGKSYSDPNLLVPVAEKNKRDERTTQNDAIRPIHIDLAENIVKQGLVNDSIRGTGSASARRESPSEVFGILTPGPRDPLNFNNRLAGHQFIMDDRIGSRQIRLRTAGAQQILMDDSNGIIYIINKSGKAWIELAADGGIHVFGAGSINMRAKGDFNLRADQNVNIEAGQNVNIKAAGDNVAGDYKGIAKGPLVAPPLGTGGTVNIEAAKDINQFAVTTFNATSAGSSINFNAAGAFKVTSGVDTGDPAAPVGISLDTKGTISVSTPTAMFLSALGSIGIQGGALIGIDAALIHLAGIMPPPIKALPAPSAPRIAHYTQEDQSKSDPVFNVDNAKDGKPSIPLQGKRPPEPGKLYKYDTIVPIMVTAEPYTNGRTKVADPKQDDPKKVGSDDTAAGAPGESNTPGKPADVQTPEGSKVGVDYKNPSGAGAGGTGTPAGGTGTAAATRGSNSAADSIRAANAALERAANSIPTYADIQNAVNNFARAAERRLMEITNINGIIRSIETAIPPIRFPITNAIQDKIIGVQKQLTELEARLNQYAIDAKGLMANIDGGAIRAMRGTLDNAFRFAANAEDLANRLKAAGITVLRDGPSIIYQDALGNKLVDFSAGLGPISASMGLAADLNGAYEKVKSMIKVPLNDNQSAAISSFVQQIGAENFASSNVLAALNEGKYSEIPRLMKTWSLGADISGGGTDGALVFREDLQERRIFEGELFQTPDEVDTSPPPNLQPGDVGFLRLAQHLANVRAEYVRQKINEFGFS
jgi:GH24 family phage-related lysozyme (muramidase)